MNKLIIFIFLISLNSFAKTNEHRQHEAHSHGSAILNIAFDNLQGKIEFKAASEGVLGFEHTAKSEKDKKALNEAISQFESTISKMIKLDSQLNCSFSKETIEMVIEATHSYESKGKIKKQELHGEHSDFIANFAVQCKKPILNTNLTLDFSNFKNLKDIDVTILVGDLQKTLELKQKPVSIELK